VIYMCRAKKSRLAQSMHYMVYESEMHLEVPDYALDMHTERGRAMGRDLTHFQEVGRVLNNEDESQDTYVEQVQQKPCWTESGQHLRPWAKDFAKKVRKSGKNMVQGVML